MLVVLEFLADKVPGVDHISDVVHTVIRPAAGALIMAGSANTISDESKIAAAVVGAVLALATHSAKASTRAAVTTTTGGLGNPIASFLEDILVVGVILLLVLAPVVGFIALVLLLILFFKAARAMFRGIRRIFGGGKSQPRPSRIVDAPNAFSDTTMTYSRRRMIRLRPREPPMPDRARPHHCRPSQEGTRLTRPILPTPTRFRDRTSA